MADSESPMADSKSPIEDSKNAVEDSKNAVEDSKNAVEDSKNAKEDSKNAKEDSKKAKEDSKKAKEDAKKAKADAKKAKAEADAKAFANLKHSDQMLNAFNPLRMFLLVYGRLPFQFTKKPDGSRVLRFAPKSLGCVYFFVSSIIAAIIFFTMVLGFITMFFNIRTSQKKNNCYYTWELWELRKYCVIVSLAVTWMLLTVIGSVFLIKYGHVYVHYLNYWFKAIDIMDMDVTTGGVKRGVMTSIGLTLSMVCVLIILYILGVVPSLNEGSGSIANSLVRLWKQDIFLSKVQQDRALEVKSERDREYCGPFVSNFDSYAAWKLFGFTIQIYAIFGSRIFIMQFRFFARVLKNAVSIWNARLKYALERGVEDPTDQTKIRLDFKLLLKDHLILAQLFRMTETCFGLIVQSFYFVQVANVGFQLYFFSQVGTSDTCTQYLTQLASSTSQECQDLSIVFSNISNNNENIIEIDDYICGNASESVLPNTLVALTLFVQTILLFNSTTNSASDAYEQAIEGFGIVRRHGFMFAKTRKERNFIHCMVVSFARNNPMILSAAGYFIVSRPLTLVVIATVANYYIILLQFKPGEIQLPC